MNLKKSIKKAGRRLLKKDFDLKSWRKIGRFATGKTTGKNLRKFITGQPRHGISYYPPTSAESYAYQYNPRSISSLMGGR